MAHKEKVYRDFSAGRITRIKAMERLEVDYSTLLDGLAEKGLPRYRLPDDEIEKAADKMLRFLGRR